MFSDPLSITINSVAQSLAAVSREPMKSTYRTSDGAYEVVISHQEGPKRNRRVVRLNRTKITTDPFIPANNVEVASSFYLVYDTPIAGYTDAEMDNDLQGLKSWLATANSLRVLAGES